MDSNLIWTIGNALRDFLSDPPTLSFKEIVDWEKNIATNPNDLALKLVYADWLQERGCKRREERVRREVRHREIEIEALCKYLKSRVQDSIVGETIYEMQTELQIGLDWVFLSIGAIITITDLGYESSWEVTGTIYSIGVEIGILRLT